MQNKIPIYREIVQQVNPVASGTNTEQDISIALPTMCNYWCLRIIFTALFPSILTDSTYGMYVNGSYYPTNQRPYSDDTNSCFVYCDYKIKSGNLNQTVKIVEDIILSSPRNLDFVGDGPPPMLALQPEIIPSVNFGGSCSIIYTRGFLEYQ